MKLITKDIFDKEMSMCQEFYQKQQGCNWWKCGNCGVLMLLQKLYTWEVIENSEDVKKFKDNILNK